MFTVKLNMFWSLSLMIIILLINSVFKGLC